MKKIAALLIVLFFAIGAYAQDEDGDEIHIENQVKNANNYDALINIFNQLYPIGENPNINWKSNMVKNENILFEANPDVKFSFYNNIFERITSNDASKNRFAQGY